MKERVLAMLLTLCMVLGMLPAGVLAADADVVSSGYCGGDESMNGRNLTWKLTSDGTLTISGLGVMDGYTGNGMMSNHYSPWYDYTESIRRCVVNEGVTSIGTHAFYPFRELTDVTLPSTLTSIGYEAFCSCEKLAEIFIPGNVTEIRDGAFYGCKALTGIRLPKSLTSLNYNVFSYCENLKTIDVEEGNLYYTSQEGVLFNKNHQVLVCCPAGKEGRYSIPDGVKTIGDSAFRSCTKLTGVGIPDSVTNIGYAAFRGCTGLTGILIPNSVETIGGSAFSTCTSLTSVKLPNSVKTLGESAFWFCRGLRRVVLSQNMKTIEGGTFEDCLALHSVIIPAGVTEISEWTFGYGMDETIGLEAAKMIIYGYSGSAAEKYVQEYNNREYQYTDITFAPLDKPTKVTLKFTDVVSGEYYEASVRWAVGQNITTGTSETTFSPNDACTRAQAVTFLWRSAGSPEPKSANNPFTDVPADQYFYKAVLWAVEQGITNGVSATEFGPDITCNRAQIVTFLYRSSGSPIAGGNPFVDVAIEDYFSDAVSWAVASGITTGTAADTFSPIADCTRAQIMTFMFRDITGVK